MSSNSDEKPAANNYEASNSSNTSSTSENNEIVKNSTADEEHKKPEVDYTKTEGVDEETKEADESNESTTDSNSFLEKFTENVKNRAQELREQILAKINEISEEGIENLNNYLNSEKFDHHIAMTRSALITMFSSGFAMSSVNEGDPAYVATGYAIFALANLGLYIHHAVKVNEINERTALFEQHKREEKEY